MLGGRGSEESEMEGIVVRVERDGWEEEWGRGEKKAREARSR